MFAIFLLGCNLASTSTTSKQTQTDFHVGMEGLTAEFSKTAQPQIVFENSNFPVLLTLRNKGAYDIKAKSGLISFGREKDYVTELKFSKNDRLGTVEKDTMSFDIEGKREINPKGDELILELTGTAGKLDPQSENKLSTITATLCYPYRTLVSATACIDTDVFGTRPVKKVCSAKEIAMSNGQGAPVAVTKIVPQMVPEGDVIHPQFLIFVENRGSGSPVNILKYNNVCSKQDSDNKDLWNVAFLKAYIRDNKQLVCCPNFEGKCQEKETDINKFTGLIRFRDNKDFVRCFFSEGVPKNYDAFTTPLRIEIDYGYVQSYSTEFFIQKPLKY